MNKDYPKWTVEACVCTVGHFRTDCPYSSPEEDEYNKRSYFAKIDDNLNIYEDTTT